MALISAFGDPGGWFALLAKPDAAPLPAVEWLDRPRPAKSSVVTTDKHFREVGFTPRLPAV